MGEEFRSSLRATPPRRQRVERQSGGADPIVLGPDLHRVVDEASVALARSSAVFQRDGELVRVLRATEASGMGVVEGTPQIRAWGPHALRDELSRVASFAVERTRKGAVHLSPVEPPKGVAEALRDRATWPGVRPLAGLLESACVRADGTICDSDGYDPMTGLLVSWTGPKVPPCPTQADARAALTRLSELFVDFPFASAPARFVPIAAVLAMLGRPAIAGSCPLFVFEASTRGSGKSLLADVVAMIATGRPAPRLTFPPDDAEMEKMLSAAALFGARLLALDNIASVLGGPALDKCLTAQDRVAMRVLGRSEFKEVTWSAVVLATGNNVMLGADTARRALVARLEPATERPEERTGFRHPDLLAHVREHRAALVVDALTVLRGFVVANRPNRTAFTWGSFSAFAELVAGAIAWAGGPNILDSRAVTLGVPDPEADALRSALAELPRVLGDKGATARDIVDRLWPKTAWADRKDPRPPDGFDNLRDALAVLARAKRSDEVPTPKAVGMGLRRGVGRVLSGRRLVADLDRTGVTRWRVEVQGLQGHAGTSPIPSHASFSETPIWDRAVQVPAGPFVPAREAS